jgi:hypothetical protein
MQLKNLKRRREVIEEGHSEIHADPVENIDVPAAKDSEG